MANPITWQNVTSNVGAGVGNFMDSARQGINDGFGAFNKVVAQRQAEQTANWDNQAKVNTQALYTALGQAKTPEEYAALQQSPEFQAQQAGMGAQYDQAAVRQFMDNRTGVLQQRKTNDDVYGAAQIDLAQRSARQDFTKAVANNDVAAQQDILAGTDFRSPGDMAIEAEKGRLSKIDQGRATEKFVQDRRVAEANIRQSDAGVTASNASAELHRSQVGETGAIKTLSNRAALAANEHAKNVDGLQTRFGAIAKSLNLPLPSNGLVNKDLLSKDELATLNAKGVELGVGTFDSIPTATEAQRDFTNREIKAGNGDTARLLLGSAAGTSATFDAAGVNTGYGVLMARDKAAKARLKEENIANGTDGDVITNPTRQTEEIGKFLASSKIPKDNQEDVMRQISKKIIGGYEHEDGTKTHYPLSVIKTAIAQSEHHWYRGQGKNAASILDDLMRRPESLTAIATGMEVLNNDRREELTGVAASSGKSVKSGSGAALSNRKPKYDPFGGVQKGK